ncbi:hypothetical protein K7711_35530 [Nocardia sp. CA2R105]|uniref:SCO2522 family protein n=1 Tax=Nocardia coffeae TaxID=2873381 RepID=UPI001CA7AF45|nr:SCO2522 family protein [Nocardia coffeae]MBY8861834.1 hypothetical protein [Nocardia coffeae]
MEFGTEYREGAEKTRIANVELSHVSIETGHFYMKELTNGTEQIRTRFRRVKNLVDLYIEAAKAEFGDSARLSTCFLIDDYFGSETDPTEVLKKILGVAGECGLVIDYLAREAGCWESPQYIDEQRSGHNIALAEMIRSWIVAEPVPTTTGGRPPDVESGWLCNGRRSSEYDSRQAMQLTKYRPSEELGRRVHSIFLDVEIWSESIGRDGSRRTHWSCPYLASIWQLLRLGMVRYEGGPAVQPQPRGNSWPVNWWEMPTVVQLNPKAAPFAAYRTLSILPQSHLKIQHAVRTILDHVHIDEELMAQAVARGAREGIEIPRELTRRLQHVFLDEVSAKPSDGA